MNTISLAIKHENMGRLSNLVNEIGTEAIRAFIEDTSVEKYALIKKEYDDDVERKKQEEN